MTGCHWQYHTSLTVPNRTVHSKHSDTLGGATENEGSIPQGAPSSFNVSSVRKHYYGYGTTLTTPSHILRLLLTATLQVEPREP